MTKKELFLELASPDTNGFSKWISVDKFIGKYSSLSFGNGGSWCRASSSLAKEYIVETDKSLTTGNSIDRIRLNGFNKTQTGSQHISKPITEFYRSKRCIILNTSTPEVDHKNGRKNDMNALSSKTQTFDDFQPLSKAANDAKRQICKECRATNIRFDAKLLGYTISYTSGTEIHDNSENGCVGCFWFDPIAFRQQLVFQPK